MKEQDTQKLLCFWQIRARVPTLLQLSPAKNVRLQLRADDTFYILLFNPELDCRSIKIILHMSAADRPPRVALKWHRVEAQFLRPLFPPSGLSPWCLRGFQQNSTGVSCLPPCAPWWQVCTRTRGKFGLFGGCKGLRRWGEVALSCSLWPKYSMNASGVKLFRWAKECPQWLPSGTLLSVQFNMLTSLHSGQGLGP